MRRIFGANPRGCGLAALRESSAPLEPEGIEPELRLTIIVFNVNVRWLASVTGVKEQAEWPGLENCRHLPMVRLAKYSSKKSSTRMQHHQ